MKKGGCNNASHAGEVEAGKSLGFTSKPILSNRQGARYDIARDWTARSPTADERQTRHAYMEGFIKRKGIEKGGREGEYRPLGTGVEEEKKKAERGGARRDRKRERQVFACLSSEELWERELKWAELVS